MKLDKLNTNNIKEEFVYRYFSIEKFIDFLETNSIYLARLDTFEDSLENIDPYDILEISFLIQAIKDLESDNVNPELPQPKETYIKSEKSKLKKIQEDLIDKQKYRFASCWVLNNVESFAMWDMYAKNGIVIRFKRKYFEQIIEKSISSQEFKTDNSDYLVIGKVSYQDYNPLKVFGKEDKMHIKYSAFRKHLSFKHEDEYRIVLFTENYKALGIKYKIPNIESLEIEVFASPRISNFQFNQFQNIINKYSNKVKLKESELKNFLDFKSLKF